MSIIDARAADLAIRGTVGDDLSITVTVVDSNGDPIDLSGYTTIQADVLRNGTSVATFTDSLGGAGNNVITLSLTDVQTTSIGNERGLTWSLEVDADGSSVTQWLAGEFRLYTAGTPGASGSTSVTLTATGAVTLTATTVAPLATLDGRYAPVRGLPSPFSAFRDNLSRETGPTCVTLLGDSTGNATDEWFYKFIDAFRASYPAWTVQYRAFSDTNSTYGPTTVLQTGTAGRSYLTLGVSTQVYLADSAAVSVVNSDFRLQAHVRLTTAGSNQHIATHYGTSGNRAWRFYRQADGDLAFGYTHDGTSYTEHTVVTQAQLTAAGLDDGDDVYIGVTFDLSNGSNSVAQGITSSDGVTWTNLGTAQTGTIRTTLYDSTEEVSVGSDNSTSHWSERIYWVEVYKGLTTAAPLAWRFDASWYSYGASSTTFVDGDNRTWTIAGNNATFTTGAPMLQFNNGSIAGAVSTYLDDSTRRTQLNSAAADVIIVNLGHNDDYKNSSSQLISLIDNAVAISDGASVVVCRQNPQVSGSSSTAGSIARQHINQQKVLQMAARNGWGVIDAYSVFMAQSDPADFIDADGIHPNAAGSLLWANEALAVFGLPGTAV